MRESASKVNPVWWRPLVTLNLLLFPFSLPQGRSPTILFPPSSRHSTLWNNGPEHISVSLSHNGMQASACNPHNHPVRRYVRLHVGPHNAHQPYSGMRVAQGSNLAFKYPNPAACMGAEMSSKEELYGAATGHLQEGALSVHLCFPL